MANTPNIDLVKPAGTDHALVSVLNSNSDKIDTFAGTTNQAIADLMATTSAISDCNSATTTGRYKTSNSTANVPFTGHFIIDVIKYNDSEIVQTARSIYFSRMFIREYTGTWTAWTELALKSELDSMRTSFGAITSTARTFTISNNSRLMLVFMYTPSSDNDAIYIVTATASGALHYTKIGGGSLVTLNPNGNNSLKISATNNINMFVTLYAGSIAEVTS